MDPWDGLGLVDFALTMCKSLYSMFSTMKNNKQLYGDLAKKVKALEDQVRTIKKGSGHIPSGVCRALKALCENLDFAQELMLRYSDISPVSGFVKSKSLKEKFLNVDKRLTDDLHMLSTAMQIEHGKVLHKVYDTVRGKRPSSLSERTSAPEALSPTSNPTPSTPPPTPTSPAAYLMAPMYPFVPVMMPMTAAMAPAAFPQAATPMTCHTTTFVSKGVSPRALKAALASQPVININQIYTTRKLL